MGAPASLESWRAGVARLDRESRPCPGVLLWAWPGVLDGLWAFLDCWAEPALEAGWTTEALFGVHRLAGAARPDSTGALITVFPRRVMRVSATEIHLARRGAVLVDRGLINPAESVPVWAFQGGERP